MTPVRLSAVGSLAHLRHARRGAAAVAIAAGVVVLTTSTTPAQAVVSPASSTSTAASVAVAKSTARTSTAASKVRVTSAISVTKVTGAKAVAKPKKKKKSTALTSARILATARKYDGSYYRHGGSTPAGFDCSGYTRYVFAKLGKSLPHNAAAQSALVRHVSRAKARAGDLIFFHSSSGHVYHVGIFAGHGKLYHASQYGVRTGLGTIFSSRVTFGRP